MPDLFDPLQIGGLTLPNRILIAPMCQYSAQEGCANDWHHMHLGHLAMSGAGLLIIEATAVSPEGRITPGDLGLYDDACEAALEPVMRAIRATSGMKTAIQLGHAGRKASSLRPWESGAQIAPDEADGWPTIAPSALAHIAGEHAPLALDQHGLNRVRDEFVVAAQRSVRLGFDGIELHMAHGYLLHQFLSPISNQRDDAYGGTPENRRRFPIEVFEAVRDAVPAGFPVWVRLSAVDWVPGGLDVAQSVETAKALEAVGCAALHVSSAGISADQKIPVGPGYQVHLASAIKAACEVPVIAVGLITEAAQAQSIIQTDQADAVALARAILNNPRWPWHAASELGAEIEGPKPYWRSAPHGVTNPFKGFTTGQR